jgi:hypothetical protein
MNTPEKNASKTQCERLLDYLTEHERINPLMAWRELGIYRLGARIFELKKDGHQITSRLIDVVNNLGEAARVAEYRMRKAESQ